MKKDKCKKCGKKYKVLVNDICANCDPDGWAKHWRKEYSSKNQK